MHYQTVGKKIILIFIFGLFSVIMVKACPIPVFRYSVEYWEPDPYRVTVFYKAELDSSGGDAVELIKDASRGAGNMQLANLELNLVDLGEQPYAIDRYLDDDQLVNDEIRVDLPWMVVQYPVIERRDTPIWKGPLTRDNAERLVTSPTREQAAEKLAQGIPVWVFLESGNRRRDNQAFELLSKELKRLEQTLELPDPEQWWDAREGDPLPEIKFSTLRVSRDDPAEKHFINMLMNSENDLFEFQSQPMVFPLYGRGIALWAIIGEGINAWTITEAAEHLVAPCSCQVKMLNPGVDILMAKNWSASVEIISDSMLAPVSGMGDFEDRGREAERRLAEETGVTEKPEEGVAPETAVDKAAKDIEPEVRPEEPAGSGGQWTVLSLIFGGFILALVVTGLTIFNISGEKGEKRK